MKICYICEEKFANTYLKDEEYFKSEIIVIMQETIEVLHIANVIKI